MNRLPPIQSWLVYAVSALLFVTGVVHYILTVEEAQVRALMMKVHGGAAMVVLVLVGSLLCSHVPLGWTTKRNRFSGVAILALSAALLTSGYLLYYAGDETLREFASSLHLLAGLVFGAITVWHATRRRTDPS